MKKIKSPIEEDFSKIRLPLKKEGEIYGIASSILGASKLKIISEEGDSKMGRIVGKIKKKMWIKEGDLLIIKVWPFQKEKCDIVFRYTKTQTLNLLKQNKISSIVEQFLNINTQPYK